MSTKKPLPPPAPHKKDDGRDRIRAVLAGSAVRATESVMGEVLLIDGELVKVIRLDVERAPRTAGLHNVHTRESIQKSTRQRFRQKGLIPWIDSKPTIVSHVEVDEDVLLNLLKYRNSVEEGMLVAKGTSFVEKPVYSKLPSMTREQLKSISDRMYARTLEEMQGELFDDAE